MTRKTQISLLAVLALIAIAPNAHAEIASKAYVDDGLSGKMNTMTVDNTPTAESANLVSSGGVAAALAGKMNTMTVDTTATANSTNLITSGAVANAIGSIDLSGKQDALGGGDNEYKVVTATGTPGVVTYTGVVDYADEDNDSLITSNAVAVIQEDLQEQVDSLGNSLENSVLTIVDAVNNVADKAVRYDHQVPNQVLTTNSQGRILTSPKLNLSALAFPTPPTACNTAGCMLMFVNGQYTWEVVTRDTNETPTVNAANAVSATETSPAAGSLSSVDRARDVVCSNGGVLSGFPATCEIPEEPEGT